MKLVHIGGREYRSQDHRFRAARERHGVRNYSYVVHDTRTNRTARVRTLLQVREAIRDFLIQSRATDAGRTAVGVGDALYRVLRVTQSPLADSGLRWQTHWEVQSMRVAHVRVDGWRFEGLGRTQRWVQLDQDYHRTPRAAIVAFLDRQREEARDAHEAVADAERAIAWAEEALDAAE
jgi:hypothetical protein